MSMMLQDPVRREMLYSMIWGNQSGGMFFFSGVSLMFVSQNRQRKTKGCVNEQVTDAETR